MLISCYTNGSVAKLLGVLLATLSEGRFHLFQGPQIPTPVFVRHYVELFDESRDGRADEALAKLFYAFPANSQYEHILFKALALNDVYSTNIKVVRSVANHILSLNIDSELAQQTPELVNKIARTPGKDGKSRWNYSFASKYCSWHVPDAYPIYDSRVDKLIWTYRQSDRFSDFFWRKDLWSDYRIFKRTIEAFREHYDLMGFSFKELDKFLWLYSKEYFDTAR